MNNNYIILGKCILAELMVMKLKYLLSCLIKFIAACCNELKAPTVFSKTIEFSILNSSKNRDKARSS